MYISARADYALRAMLAAADVAGTTGDPAAGGGELVKAASLAESQDISVGDVLRAVGGAITSVRGIPADRAGYHGVATGLRDVWLAVDGAIALVVDRTTLADLLSDRATAP